MSSEQAYHPVPLNVNSSNHSLLRVNLSRCKYYHAASNQCYVSDEHLKEEIWAFLQPTPTEWSFLALYLLCFLLGLLGNGLVVWAVVRNVHLRSTTNVLLTNLALADFLAVLVCMPPSFVQTIWETWFLGKTLCKVVEYYQVIVVLVSILTLTAISVERYCAICRPLTFKETRRRVVVCLVLIWLAAHLAAVPRIFIMDLRHDELIPPDVTVMMTSCVPSSRMEVVALCYEVFLCVVFYGLPILVMGFAYIAVALCLWTSSNTSCLTETDSSAMMSQLKARRRIALMLIVVVIAFIVCSLPVYIWNMVRLMSPSSVRQVNQELVSGITLGAQLLPMINSSINPIIYNFMSAKFRKEFHAACCCDPCFMKSAANANNSCGHEMSRLKHKTNVGEREKRKPTGPHDMDGQRIGTEEEVGCTTTTAALSRPPSRRPDVTAMHVTSSSPGMPGGL